MPHEHTAIKEPRLAGSRDVARSRLKAAQAALMEAVDEIQALQLIHGPKALEYRVTGAYLGQALCSIDLAIIAMRKRKKHDAPVAQAVTGAMETPQPLPQEV